MKTFPTDFQPLRAILRRCSESVSSAHALYDHETGMDLWYRPFYAAGEPVRFLRTPALEEKPAISPDGAYVAYLSDESGKYKVYVRPFPDGEGKWQVSAGSGDWPLWSRSGDEILFRGDDSSGPGLWSVAVQRHPSLTLGPPRRLFSASAANLVLGWGRRWDIAPDGQSFVAVQSLGGPGAPSSLTVVQSWYAQLAGRR